jgi:hypothetical protein
LIMPAKIRLRSGWLEALGGHVRGGGGDALIVGDGGAFSGRCYGVLIGRGPAQGLAHPDLKRLRGELGRGAVRLT